jgi:starvation-inducible DNA-binding protein
MTRGQVPTFISIGAFLPGVGTSILLPLFALVVVWHGFSVHGQFQVSKRGHFLLALEFGIARQLLFSLADLDRASGMPTAYRPGRTKSLMQKTLSSNTHPHVSAQPRLHQSAPEIQAYGTVSHLLALELEEPVRLEMTERLNQLLVDTITLRDLYKKSHWQVAGPTFYQLHLLFDKHFEEQSNLVDAIAERIQLLGGISLAMAPDVAETTRIARPPRGREEVPVQLSRLLDAHQIIIRDCRDLASRASRLGDDGTNDLVVSQVQRGNELQTWFLSEHLVNVPLVEAENNPRRSA